MSFAVTTPTAPRTVSPARSARIRAAHAARRITKPDLFNPVDPTVRIRVALPYPPSANRYWRSSVQGHGKKAHVHTYVSEDAEAYKADVARICEAAGIRPIIGDVTIVIDVYRPRKVGDLSNRIKVLEDALAGLAIEDDKQVRHVDIQYDDDKNHPGIEIEVRPWAPRARLERFAAAPLLAETGSVDV